MMFKARIKINLSLLKKFSKEKSGSGILEFLVILCIFAVVAALVSPVVKDQLANMFNNQSHNMTFDGQRGDVLTTNTPQSNPAPEVDESANTN
ncbi:hypothetical protein AAGG74_15855 [Bacillus mexicanus]|uniref:hypothetical protein n=1 Tax=Bacillus mexicanus TaxID=2834415 RepID=UPI003D193DC1